MRVYCILFYTRVLIFTRVYTRGLMTCVIFAFAHVFDTRGLFKLWVICTVVTLKRNILHNLVTKVNSYTQLCTGEIVPWSNR